MTPQDGSATPGRCRIEAPAKINLYLAVGGRRPDGFHELGTVFQAVGLYDRLELALTRHGMELHVDGPDLGRLEENLAYRAAQAFAGAVELDVGVRMSLEKGIPAGAGLGGGSSDAAAVLRGLNALTGRPLRPEALMELGADLGSDVPFFLGRSTTAVGRGRGDRISSAPPLPERGVVLVLPPVHVSTAIAYGELARPKEGKAAPLAAVPDPGLGWEALSGRRNDFQKPIAARFPEVATALEALTEAQAVGMLSGSGAACFAILPSLAEAHRVAADVGGRLPWTTVAVPTLGRFPPPALF